MADSIREIIERGDADSLRALVAEQPSLVDAEVRWGEGGKNAVPPLHFVCDAVFRGLATEEQARTMAEVLVEAGADPNRAYARSGDTFLIAAASLGAEEVGLFLLARGARVEPRGLFGATALHWAAIMGLERLVDELAAKGSNLELADEQYHCTPLQWALHGWSEGTNGRHDCLPGVVRVLREHGAQVPGDALDSLGKDSDEPMRRALNGSS